MPVAHVGHVELRVPDVARSVEFLTTFVGLRLTGHDGDTAYLRAWQDWDHHTLQLTEAPEAGPRPPRLARAAERGRRLALEASSRRAGSSRPGSRAPTRLGHGDALRFTTPGGLPFELYWEVEPLRGAARAGLALAQPSRRSIPARGAGSRGASTTSRSSSTTSSPSRSSSPTCSGSATTTTSTGPTAIALGLVAELQQRLARDVAGHEERRRRPAGCLHHVAYYADSTDEVLRTATLLVDHGYELEWGPGKHGTSGATFLYFRSPAATGSRSGPAGC